MNIEDLFRIGHDSEWLDRLLQIQVLPTRVGNILELNL